MKNICTCKVVVFSLVFFQPNCNKVFCFYTQISILFFFPPHLL